MLGEPEGNSLFLVVPDFAYPLFEALERTWITVRMGSEVVMYFPQALKAKDASRLIQQELIPFNRAYFSDEDDFWPDLSQSVRYDSDGTLVVQTNMHDWDANTSDAYVKMLRKPVPNFRLAQRFAMALLINQGWRDQERNAQLHRTRKLLGDPDCEP